MLFSLLIFFLQYTNAKIYVWIFFQNANQNFFDRKNAKKIKNAYKLQTSQFILKLDLDRFLFPELSNLYRSVPDKTLYFSMSMRFRVIKIAQSQFLLIVSLVRLMLVGTRIQLGVICFVLSFLFFFLDNLFVYVIRVSSKPNLSLFYCTTKK